MTKTITMAPPIPLGIGIKAKIKLTKNKNIMIPIINSKIPTYITSPFVSFAPFRQTSSTLQLLKIEMGN